MQKSGIDIEPEEILLDSSSSFIAKIEKPIGKRRLIFFSILINILMIILLLFAFRMQILKGDYYRAKADLNAARVFKIPAPRGIIYDRNKKALVYNQPKFDLVMDYDFFKSLNQESLDRLKSEIEKILHIKIEKLNESEDGRDIILLEDLSQENVLVLRSSSFLNQNKGLRLESSIARFYPYKDIISHVLGYIGKINQDEYRLYKKYGYELTDNIGKGGIELFYESELRGIDGYKKYEVDASGKILKELTEQTPFPGKNIVLNIDIDLQQKVFEVLNHFLDRSENKAAAAIALNPQNGEILAMVSLPSFDNNIFTYEKNRSKYLNLVNDKNKPLFNRVIAGTYPSGSTIKPFIASAALEEKIINPERKIYASASISVPNIYNPNIIYTFHDWKEHGLINMKQAIAFSSNVYFYTIGGGYNDIKGLGPEKIAKYLSLFGFGKDLGIDIFGEAAGIIPIPDWKKTVKNEDWYIGDTYNLSIGQGDFLITPLQLAAATAIIANGGILYVPRLRSDRPLKILGKDFIKPENLRIVQEGMRMAVVEGSARYLNSLPVKVAAKTGTAQNPFGNHHAWATIYAPYENPEIVLVVLFERAGEGSSVAIPAAREILDWYFRNKNKE